MRPIEDAPSAVPPHPATDPTEVTVADDPPHPLREVARALPPLPGVYTFHGPADAVRLSGLPGAGLPLYIGKSVNLRQRVLSHLRDPSERRMMAQTQRITVQRTAGDLGAQLLEAQLIKQQHPVFNQRLRRNRQLCAWWLPDGETVPRLVQASEVNFARQTGLFGLFASRHAAVQALQQWADEQRLCWGALGLERLAPGKPCFRQAIRRCAGVCAGHEPPAAHTERLRLALTRHQLMAWPHEGAVAVVERCPALGPWPALRQVHVVRNWCYLGSAPTLAAARRLDTPAAAFDADTYQVLCRPLWSGAVAVRPLG